MRFVGVDSAYRHTGVVILDPTGDLVSRHHFVNKELTDPEGFCYWFGTFLNLFQPGDVVALEGLSFGSIGRSHVLAGTYALCQLTAISRAETLFVVPPTRVKKWATNNGEAKKSDMIAWAKRQFELGPKDKVSEHEADALSLATIAFAAAWYLDDTLDRNSWDWTYAGPRAEMISNEENGIARCEGKSYFKGIPDIIWQQIISSLPSTP